MEYEYEIGYNKKNKTFLLYVEKQLQPEVIAKLSSIDQTYTMNKESKKEVVVKGRTVKLFKLATTLLPLIVRKMNSNPDIEHFLRNPKLEEYEFNSKKLCIELKITGDYE